MYAPILLFVYNRPTHLRRTVEALQANVLAGESDLFIYADAARAADAALEIIARGVPAAANDYNGAGPQ